MLGLCPGWEIGRRLGGLRLSLFSLFQKEDTKRHRKTLWKSGSITIATKKKYSGLRRKICGGFLFARKEAAACMPYKPKRPCSYPGCPRLTSGRYCEEHQKIITAHYNKHQRDPASKRRYGRAWKRIRDRYITAHPLCEQCQRAGKITPAEEVHHILPLSKGGTHVESNLMALCKRCHSEITAREGGRWG